MEAIPQTDPDAADDTVEIPLAADPGVFLSVETSGDSAPKYTSRLTLALPIVQLFVGPLCILLQVVVLINEQNGFYHVPANTAPGLWCGTLYVICGITGILASRWKHKRSIMAFLVLSVLSIISVPILAGVSATSLMNDQPNYGTQEGTSETASAHLRMAYISNGILLFLAAVELILSTSSSILSARAVCRCDWSEWTSSNQVSYQPLLAM